MEERYREQISDIQHRYGTTELESAILYHLAQVNQLLDELPGGRTGPEIMTASLSFAAIYRLIAQRVAARHYPGWDDTKSMTDEEMDTQLLEE